MPDTVQKSFFDEPLELTLAPFVEFGFSSVLSWAEVELYASACGVEVDGNFLNVMCTAAWWFDNLYRALLAELSSADSLLAKPANSVSFVECVFKVWTYPRRGAQPQDEFYRWIQQKEGAMLMRSGTSAMLMYGGQGGMESMKKYGLLSALGEKFPYLLVKFYALHAKDLRRDDMKFVSWLRARLEQRVGSDPRLAPVLAAMDAEAKEMDRTAMYMR